MISMVVLKCDVQTYLDSAGDDLASGITKTTNRVAVIDASVARILLLDESEPAGNEVVARGRSGSTKGGESREHNEGGLHVGGDGVVWFGVEWDVLVEVMLKNMQLARMTTSLYTESLSIGESYMSVNLTPSSSVIRATGSSFRMKTKTFLSVGPCLHSEAGRDEDFTIPERGSPETHSWK